MKHFLSHVVSGLVGALMVIILLIGFDILNTYFPIYIPNIFFKEKIDYYVNVESTVSEAIDQASKNVVGVLNYRDETLQGTGSGVIYKLTEDKAYIVTNYHVVEDASKIEIETYNGYKVSGEVIGTDYITDLAVVTIPKGLIDYSIDFSDSNALKVGEYVIAIGNPLGLSGSATLGIISSTDRLIPVDIDDDQYNDWYATVIQTDAAINPGNSGGALINLSGKLVGINSMKIADSDVEGIGFSIPSNLVMRIISDLEAHGKVERPLLGIKYLTVSTMNSYQRRYYGVDDSLNYGLFVSEVILHSSAYTQGLKDSDIILEVDGKKITSTLDFTYILYNHEVGDEITLTILRDYETIELFIVLESNL